MSISLLCAATLCAAIIPGAYAQGGCNAVQARALPQPAVCLRDFGIGADTDPVQRLLSLAKERAEASRYEDSERILDCAEAVMGRSAVDDRLHELAHARGALDYKRERIPQALGHLQCALLIAERMEDSKAIASEMNSVGSTLRRLGDYRGALDMLMRSLSMQRASGEASGPVLNNIGDVYRDLGEPEQAMRYYKQALEVFRKGNHKQAGHVLTTMAALVQKQGDLVQAQSLLEQAFESFRRAGNPRYEPLAYARLAQIALDRGDVDKARTLGLAGLAVADRNALPIPGNLQLQVARTDRLSGQFGAAQTRLQTALMEVAEGDSLRTALQEELSRAQADAGDLTAALDSLRRAKAEEGGLIRAQQDRQLTWLRTWFETSEYERRNAQLEATNRQRTLQLWATVVTALATGLALWLVLQRRRQRERLQAEAQRVRQEEELARYRREADALTEDRQLLQALLDSRDDAVCLLDAEGNVLAANLSACRLLCDDAVSTAGRPFADFVAEPDRDALAAALESMEDEAVQPFEFSRRDKDVSLVAQLTQWDRGDGLIVIGLRERRAEVVVPALVEDEPAVDAVSNESRKREEFRRALVELMLAVVETWERSTGSTRLELAEKSRIWRVTVDDGRLRIRAMERYLSLSKLPHNPRWRDVLRSAYFVLGQCEMAPSSREDLQRRVDAVLTYTRRSALV